MLIICRDPFQCLLNGFIVSEYRVSSRVSYRKSTRGDLLHTSTPDFRVENSEKCCSGFFDSHNLNYKNPTNNKIYLYG